MDVINIRITENLILVLNDSQLKGISKNVKSRQFYEKYMGGGGGGGGGGAKVPLRAMANSYND